MNIQTEHNDQHQAMLTVELEPAQIERKKQQAARKLARTTHIPGFRPGKAPYHMVLRHIGEGRILEEAIEGLIDEIYPKVLDESGVQPYGPGKLENLSLEATPPTAQFSIPLAPVVTLGDYKSLRFPYERPEVTDDNVAKAIEGMREMYAEVTLVDRPAEESDLVNIELSGKFTDSEEETPYIDHKSYPVVIEPETADATHEWPFPGFSRLLIGASAGENKTASYTFPEDYEDEETEEGDSISLKGKTANYEISVTKVSSRVVPAIDETFIKRMGPYETVEEFEADTHKQLLERESSGYDEAYAQQILDSLVNGAEIKYPQEAVEDELDLVFNRLKSRLENQGISMDIYVKAVNKTEEELREDMRPGAEQRLKESLLLMEVATQENIQVDPNEVQHEIEHTLGHLLSGMSEREARRAFNDDALRGLTANIYNNTLLNKTLQHLRDMASGELEKQAALATDAEATANELEGTSSEAISAEESSTEDAPVETTSIEAASTEPAFEETTE
ncbi:MAG: trigger factor [Anaerolineales bacterium]|nr:trigger factor [Anaerolineales bacterium]